MSLNAFFAPERCPSPFTYSARKSWRLLPVPQPGADYQRDFGFNGDFDDGLGDKCPFGGKISDLLLPDAEVLIPEYDTGTG
jgi:hypothetical protein